MSNPVFQSVQVSAPRRNRFDLSFDSKFTCEMGSLYPVFCKEMIPGDTFRVNAQSFVRLASMVAPMLQRVDCYLHFFFVPNRLIYDDWNDFLVGGDDGLSTDYVPPFAKYLNLAQCYYAINGDGSRIPNGSLCDFLGLPTNITPASSVVSAISEPVSLLPFRAYQLIYNEYYRDENLVDEVEFSREGGEFEYYDAQSQPLEELDKLVALRKRAWRKDYFTSALPFAQKGAAVLLPLQGSAPLTGTPRFEFSRISDVSRRWLAVDPSSTADFSADAGVLTKQNFSADGDWKLTRGDLAVDLQAATSTTIEDFRVAMRVQEWLERNALGGTRYIETILAHFGVITPDARLQRPEYLGGGITPVTISDIEQSAPEAEYVDYSGDKPQVSKSSPLGTLAGKGLSAGNINHFKYFAYEHGFVIGIWSIMPRASYFQGLPRMFSRLDKFDYYWPEFAHLGEQEVYNKEIYLDEDNSSNQKVFGYQSRYVEYKCSQDEIHGDFRGSLSFWHMARIFGNRPGLNQEFIEVDPGPQGLNRPFAVLSENWDHFLCEIYFKVDAIRPMPVFAQLAL